MGLGLRSSVVVALLLVIIPSWYSRRKRKSSAMPKSFLIDKPASVGRKVVGDGSAPSSEEDTQYDIVILGGGTAGCVLASRLSDDSNVKVLLLEAGGSSLSLIPSVVPAMFSEIMRRKHDWNYYTEPQEHAAGRVRAWTRAKLLGGCSASNAMMFHAGAPSDYDEWDRGNQPGSEEWSYEKFSKYFLKFEKYVPNAEYPGADPKLRGVSGPVEVGHWGHLSNLSSKFLESCAEVGIQRSHDFNTSAGTLGVSKIMTYISPKGRRVTTESAYLTPEVLKRPNLKVATHAHVTRILFDTPVGGRPRAIGVEFAHGKNKSVRYRVRATREVVLSAGSINTPQILMLSGVGPRAELEKHKIPVVADLEGVGAHLQDHQVVNVRYRTARPGISYVKYMPKTIMGQLRGLPHLIYWYFTGRGWVTINISDAAAFVRSDDPKLFPPEKYPKKLQDATSGPNAPDLELISSPFAWKDHGFDVLPAGDLISLCIVALRPTSFGRVALKSSDPFDQPTMDPNYCSTQNDVDVLVRGVRLAAEIVKTGPMSKLLDQNERDPLLDHALHDASDDDLEKLVRERVETLYHPASTARMAPLAEKGVVDAYLRVHGIDGLRIADASIFPTINAGHTAAPCIAIGEKASDIIKASLKA